MSSTVFAARPHLHRGGGLPEALDEASAVAAHRYEDAPGETPLPGVAVGGGDDVGHGFIQHGVGHRYHGVLRPGKRLNPLFVRRAVHVDVLGHGLAPDK